MTSEKATLFFTSLTASGPTSQTSAAECFRSRAALFFTSAVDASLPIKLPLSLSVALGGFGMRAPVGLLIIGVLGAPLLAAVLDHLRIHRVGLNLPTVVIGPAMPLALRLAANALLESIWGWVKASLAVWTAAGLGQCVSSEIERDSNF